MSNHANISIFVPHIGCPNRCSFCNQNAITGKELAPDAQEVMAAVECAVKSGKCDPQKTEIAFFGGSFTAICREYMVSLLTAAEPYVKEGTVRGIRISTRPDAINGEMLTLLKRYGVTAIELGAQSMDDGVLSFNRRGHTVADVVESAERIRNFGFELGLQMMTGLPRDTEEKSIETAKALIALKPDTVRIYPTIVLKNTLLAQWYRQGIYTPQGVEDAVRLAVKLLELFENAGIRVIRLGLHTVPQEEYLSGPFHPAFGELCESERYFKKMITALKQPGNYRILCAPGDISKIIGQKRKNMIALRQKGVECRIVQDQNIKSGEFKVERDETNAVNIHSGAGI